MSSISNSPQPRLPNGFSISPRDLFKKEDVSKAEKQTCILLTPTSEKTKKKPKLAAKPKTQPIYTPSEQPSVKGKPVKGTDKNLKTHQEVRDTALVTPTAHYSLSLPVNPPVIVESAEDAPNMHKILIGIFKFLESKNESEPYRSSEKYCPFFQDKNLVWVIKPQRPTEEDLYLHSLALKFILEKVEVAQKQGETQLHDEEHTYHVQDLRIFIESHPPSKPLLLYKTSPTLCDLWRRTFLYTYIPFTELNLLSCLAPSIKIISNSIKTQLSDQDASENDISGFFDSAEKLAENCRDLLKPLAEYPAFTHYIDYILKSKEEKKSHRQLLADEKLDEIIKRIAGSKLQEWSLVKAKLPCTLINLGKQALRLIKAENLLLRQVDRARKTLAHQSETSFDYTALKEMISDFATALQKP